MNAKIFLTVAVVLASFIVVSSACRYDSDCGAQQIQCLNGRCVTVAKIECQRNKDCLKKGIYFECKNMFCVPSKHKICLTDHDCSKNWLNKHCRNDRCQH